MSNKNDVTWPLHPLQLHEVLACDNGACRERDRYIVSFVVGYEHNAETGATTPREAAARANDAHRDAGATVNVFDRATGIMHTYAFWSFAEADMVDQTPPGPFRAVVRHDGQWCVRLNGVLVDVSKDRQAALKRAAELNEALAQDDHQEKAP